VLIKGTVRRGQYARCCCPQDGIHRATRSGLIKHPKVSLLDGEPLYHGNEGFYWSGVKVYYSFRFNAALDRGAVVDIKNNMDGYGELCVKTNRVVTVTLDLVAPTGKGVARKVFGIEVEQVQYPQPAWERFCKGNPYDWYAVSHPDHTVDGFKRFVASAQKVLMPSHAKSACLGNVAWCTNKSRWIIMDVDRTEQ